jgi:glyoxylase I family protein
MPQPSGSELEAIRERRRAIRDQYLRPSAKRPPTIGRGIHHAALICRDVVETIDFYQGLLGFPLVELVENRDYAGSSHFFFDVGNNNLLGFFDFPGYELAPYMETIGAVQHIAISVDHDHFVAAKTTLDDAGIKYDGPNRGIDESMYLRDPNGVGIELYEEQIGVFDGRALLA